MKVEVVKTGDGSHSLFVPEMDEYYHSTHGAMRESLHVFIQKGWEVFRNKETVNILEVGLGTGLNVFLTALFQGNVNVNYTGIEPFPLEQEVWRQLNYAARAGRPDREDLFRYIHQSPWEEKVEIADRFELLKQKISLADFQPKETYDLIYFDAFAPKYQEAMWELAYFEKLFHHLSLRGVLVTYCAKGSVKRDLKKAGFDVESLEGPPGKREMVRGWLMVDG